LNHEACNILDTAEERNMNTVFLGIAVRSHLHDQCTRGGIVRIPRAAFSAWYSGCYDSKYSCSFSGPMKRFEPCTMN
jgi:hypothetical protein